MTTAQEIARGVDALVEKITTERLFDDQVAVTKRYDPNMGAFEVTIAKNTGNYTEGEFVFEIGIEGNRPPQIRCKTPIYHLDINTIKGNGEVSIDLELNCSMEDVVKGLLHLMDHPTFPIIECDLEASDYMKAYWQGIDTSIAGGEVDGHQFPVNPRYARLHPSANEEEVDDQADDE